MDQYQLVALWQRDGGGQLFTPNFGLWEQLLLIRKFSSRNANLKLKA